MYYHHCQYCFRVDEDESIGDTVNPEQEDEEEEGGKRAITYQVSDTLQYMIKFKYMY